VTKLSLTEPTLNEVYLEYTGKAMRDTEESKEAFISQRITLRRARGG
jgi:ABC-2 type transport system ATP-binding protein